MPDLWSALIGVVERYWEGKPRKDVAASLVTLRENMIDCQRWYEAYTALRKQGDVDKLWRKQWKAAEKAGLSTPPHPQVEWIRSLTGIGDAILRLDSVLSIFSPETHNKIERYHSVESLEAGAMGMLLPAAEELGQPPGFNLEEGTLEPTFKTALDTLDAFIKENFKPEEVFKAKRLW